MGQHTTGLLATAFALVVCSSLATGCNTASIPPLDIIADSVIGFSGKQGVSSASMLAMDQLQHGQIQFATAAEGLFKQSMTTEIHNRSRQSAEGLQIFKNFSG